MRKVSENEYLDYVPWAKDNTANRVYPCSIAEGTQSGDIYVNDGGDVETVLFWHYCGFAYISGTVSERILREIWNDICHKDRRRMFLITDNDTVTRFFRKKGAETGRRVEYEYAGKVLGFPDDCFMPCFIGMGRPKKEEKPVRQVEIDPGERIHWDRY